jgi:hypothetical protein
MQSRKVIKINKCFYVNIPLEISGERKIEKGDSLKIRDIPGQGILITQAQGIEKVSVNLDSIETLKRAAYEIITETKKELRTVRSSFTSEILRSLVGELVRCGLFDLRARVDKLEKQVEESDKGKDRLTLVRKGKGSDH